MINPNSSGLLDHPKHWKTKIIIWFSESFWWIRKSQEILDLQTPFLWRNSHMKKVQADSFSFPLAISLNHPPGAGGGTMCPHFFQIIKNFLKINFLKVFHSFLRRSRMCGHIKKYQDDNILLKLAPNPSCPIDFSMDNFTTQFRSGSVSSSSPRSTPDPAEINISR